MNNLEIYTKVFTETFEISVEQAQILKYQDIAAWDSIGHMDLVASIEDAFDIMMDSNDIIDFSSFEKGKEILSKNYNIVL